MANFIRAAVISGLRAVASAFTMAYNNIAYGGAKNQQHAEAAVNRMFKKQMSIEEARQILDVTSETPRDEIQKKYEILFAANDVEKGGSFYLQSKIYRAKEQIDLDLQKRESGQAQSPPGSGPSTSDGQSH